MNLAEYEPEEIEEEEDDVEDCYIWAISLLEDWSSMVEDLLALEKHVIPRKLKKKLVDLGQETDGFLGTWGDDDEDEE